MSKRRSPYRSVLRLKQYRRLWLAMGVSSLGDWIGLFALVSITHRVAPRNTLAIAGLMVARVLPALVVAPLAGVALDRVDRRRAMIACDVVRVVLVAGVPFVASLPTLYAVSFGLEATALVWMPAKDALVPQLVPNRWLVAANGLSLLTTYAVFPIGAAAFTSLAGIAEPLHVTPERLALWVDAATFAASAILVSRVEYPGLPRARRALRLRAVLDDAKDGIAVLRAAPGAARVMRGIGVAVAGGAVLFSLGAPYVTQVLGGGARGFGAVLTSAGVGVGLGVLVLGVIGDRAPAALVFASATIAVGVLLAVSAAVSVLALAIVLAGALGACGGMAYATGFALVQQAVEEPALGRTMSALQLVVRVSMLGSLVVFPAIAHAFGGDEDGVRIAIALGGLVTCAAGMLAARDVYLGRLHGRAQSGP